MKHARIELYKYLDILQERALYFDTDSVIYTQKPGEVTLQTGDYLGDLTDELCGYGEGSYISEFVGGGPKNYAFSVYTPESRKVTHVSKVKGVTLNYQNIQKINFHTMKKMILKTPNDEDEAENLDVIKLENDGILRTRDNVVYTGKRTYNYRINVTKRRRLGENGINTLPFGHNDNDS